MASIFIPVLPTYSANLAGTASVTAQWYVGRGCNAFGFTGDNGLFKYIGTGGVGALPGQNAVNFYDQELECKFGGYFQGQYWFTNQWYLNVAWGYSRIYNLPDQGFVNTVANAARVTSADQYLWMSQIDATLYFRPIESIKFGLQYSYGRTKWLYATANPVTGGRFTPYGQENRVEFAAYFYF